MRTQLFSQPAFIPEFAEYDHLHSKHIGITGHQGVLGQILCERLADQNINITAFEGDVTDLKALEKWFELHQFTHFFHLAAIVPVNVVNSDPLRACEVNVMGTCYICREIIRTQKNCRLFLASSSHVYRNQEIEKIHPLNEQGPLAPATFYGQTKLMAEQIAIPLLEQCSRSFCVGRIFSFSHRYQQEPYLVPSLHKRITQLEANQPLELINPDSIRDIMDAETVVDCIFYLLCSDFCGIVNIGSGKGLKIEDIAKRIAKQDGRQIHIQGINRSVPNALIADVTLLKKILSKKE